MNPIENPATATELRFFLGLIFNYIVGMLIASGKLDPSVRDQFVSQAVDITGYLIILITSGIGLFHLARTSRKITATPTQKIVSTTELVATPTIVAPPVQPAPAVPMINSGTPPSAEQILGDVSAFLGKDEQNK